MKKKKQRLNKKRIFILGGCIFLCLSIIMIINVVIKESKLNEERLKDNAQKERIILTLDINPSIKIEVDKDENVLDVVPINEDAKKIITRALFVGKTLKASLEILVDKIIDNKYTFNDNVSILLYGENIDLRETKYNLESILSDKNYNSDVIIYNNAISESAKELASKYNVSEAKAAYVESFLKDKKSLTVEDVINRSISEIKEMKDSGKYCLEDYYLNEGYCYKEKERNAAPEDKVCPQELEDNDVNILVGNECVTYEVLEAELIN